MSPRHSDTSDTIIQAAASSSPVNSSNSSLCITCKLVVEECELAMECDLCHRYTHVKCDDNMCDEIYSVLAKHPNNSLLYLCSLCEPKLKSSTHHQKFIDQAVTRLEKVSNESHQCLEFQMDILVKSVSSQVGNLCSTVDGINTHLSSLEATMLSKTTLEDQTSGKNQNSPKASTYPPNKPDQEMMNIKSKTPMNATPDVSRPPPNVANAPPYLLPHLSQTPPNIRHMRLVLGHPSPIRQIQNAPVYRGPPLFNLNPRKPKPPDPDKSLVVYNIPSSWHPFRAASKLAADCDVYDWQIVSVQALPTSRSNPPIAITCKEVGTKWHMIKEINKINSIYAKPFLAEDERKADQELVRKLRATRQKHKDKTFKIHRGQMYEVIDNKLVQYSSTTNTQPELQLTAETPTPPLPVESTEPIVNDPSNQSELTHEGHPSVEEKSHQPSISAF